MTVQIVDEAAAGRYVARLDGAVAGILEYALKHGRLALIHTEVEAAYQGRGIASELARHAFADARRRGLRVIAVCPYVRAYLDRHPEEGDVVIGARPSERERARPS